MQPMKNVNFPPLLYIVKLSCFIGRFIRKGLVWFEKGFYILRMFSDTMSKLLNRSHLWGVLNLLGYICQLRLIVFLFWLVWSNRKIIMSIKWRLCLKSWDISSHKQFGNNHYNSFIQSYQRGINFLDSWCLPFKHPKLFLYFLDCSIYNNHFS